MRLTSLLRKQPRVAPAAVAAGVRALAASVRVGVPPRAALEAWPPAAPEELRPALDRVMRLLRLGEAPRQALSSATEELGPAADAVGRCLDLHREVGGSLPLMLEGVAEAVERADATARGGRAATSGARLSARLVAGLPLAFVPFTSGAGAFRSGPAGLLLVATGAVLGGAGLWWIGRLVPRGEGDDGVATLADDLATALAGGVGLLPALDAVTARPPRAIEEPVTRACRRVRLGESWTGALGREGDGLDGLARVLGQSAAWGIPAATALREWAEARRAAVETELRRSLQRAPVLMVVPLVVCVLPSFALLAFGPFVLGALQGA